MAIEFAHFTRQAPVSDIRQRDIPGYVGVDQRQKSLPLPLIEMTGRASGDYAATLYAGEGDPCVLTNLDTTRGTENIRPCGYCWKKAVEASVYRTAHGPKIDFTIIWQPIGAVS